MLPNLNESRVRILNRIEHGVGRVNWIEHGVGLNRVRCSIGRQNRFYSSSYGSLMVYWNRIQTSIESVKSYNPFKGSLLASTRFREPYPLFTEFEFLSLAFYQLLELYAYRIDSDYIKLTIGLNMCMSMSSDIFYTLGNAIPLCDLSGNIVPKKSIYEEIERRVRQHGERYQYAEVSSVFIRLYYINKDTSESFPPIPDLLKVISEVIDYKIDGEVLPEVRSLMFKKLRIPKQITTYKGSGTKLRSFIVADIETILVATKSPEDKDKDGNLFHFPYACGFLLVHPGDVLTSLPPNSMHTYFCEDLPSIYPTFEDRSERMMFDFLYNLDVTVMKNKKLGVRTVFYHNTKHSNLTRNIIDRTKSAFIDIPHSICDITSMCSNFFLTLGFSFLPGQTDFISKNVSLPETTDSLIDIRNQLGYSLSLFTDSITNKAKIKYNTISENTSNFYSRILVEAITYNNGFYGRFLVLVELGIGCTIWYGFISGTDTRIPVDGLLFNPIENYDSFLNHPEIHVQPGFNKITLIENEENILPKIAKAYTNEKPFMDIKIPNASGNVLISVSVGLAIVILLSCGIDPHADLNAISI